MTRRDRGKGDGTTPLTTRYPPSISSVNQTAPVPRRIRAVVAGRTVLDTTNACYVWEHAKYPQYYIPFADIDGTVLVDEDRGLTLSRGHARRFGLQVVGVARPHALLVYGDDALAGLSGMARFEWGSVDAWYEEDERVFVHPRDPYTRVDAIRSTRHLEIRLGGVLLAVSSSPVMVFETGLPTRYYVDPMDVDHSHLRPSDTVTECPYKGTTSGYWTAQVGEATVPDVAWTYAFPTRALQPIAGLVAFYNEKVDITLDGLVQGR